MGDQSIKQLIEELKLEHKWILHFIDDIVTNGIQQGIEEFEQYFLQHIMKEDAKLYPDVLKIAKKLKADHPLNAELLYSDQLRMSFSDIIKSKNIVKIAKLNQAIKNRIKFEEDVLFKMFD